jgi:hypothetical protein
MLLLRTTTEPTPGDYDNDGLPNITDEDLYSDQDELECGSNSLDGLDTPFRHRQ